MEDDDVVRALGALAHPQRLRAFRALVVAGADGLTPGALVALLGLPGNALSFHLKELAAAGLVSATRDGRHLIYRAAYARMNAVLGYLTANCCAGAPCEIDAADGACGC